MEPQTELDEYILAQVAPHLGPDETVEACAYLVQSAVLGLSPSKAQPWFLALTNERLFRIKTRPGAFKPRAENHGLEVDARADIAAIHVSHTLLLRFKDGREMDFLLLGHKGYISSQAAFIEQLQQNFGHGPAAAALVVEQTAFERGLHEMTPRLIVTPLLVAINIGVFVLMVINGVSLMSPTVPDLLKWGADFGPLTTGGEYWRLLTCTFIHIGIIHLAFNMWVLWDLGRLVERLVGNVGFFCLYFVSGLLGSVISVWFNPLIVSAGASGAVFGVAGALVGIVLIDRGAIPAKRLKQLRGSIGTFLAYNLVFGFTVPNIDMAAHVGGLAAGVVCGLILARSASKAGHPQRLRRALVVALLGAALIPSLALALPSDVADAQKVLDEFVQTEERVLGHINDAAKQKISDQEFATLLETKVLPDWSASRKRMAELKDLPPSFEERVALLERYATLREDGWKLTLKAIQQNDEALAKQGEAKQAEAEKVIEQLTALMKE